MALRTYRAEGRRRASRLLFLVHNYGGNEFQMALLGTLIDPGRRFAVVCPRGPIETADVPDGASFYRVERATKSYDEASFAAAVEALDDTLEDVCADGGFDRSEAVLGGFSQGGGLALALAYRRSGRARPAATITFAPPVHPAHRVAWDPNGARSTAAFVAHGTADAMFPAPDSRRFVHELRAAGADATWRPYPGGHQLALEMLGDARDWLAGR